MDDLELQEPDGGLTAHLAIGGGRAAEAVEFYKKAYPAKLQELRSMSPDAMTKTVDFFGMFKSPAAGLLGMANNHGIHHRGQLAAYLRALGSKVPAIYGGSADEPMMNAAAS